MFQLEHPHLPQVADRVKRELVRETEVPLMQPSAFDRTVSDGVQRPPAVLVWRSAVALFYHHAQMPQARRR